jgi:catechol 2,3-dioxygenase-like lactoylglutathione lyase family enzyme
MTAGFEGMAPVLPVRDLDAALERFGALGFSVRAFEGGARYGYCERGEVSLHLSEWPGFDPATSGSQVYLYVTDADAVHDEWRAAGVEGSFHEPEDTTYGLREFAYVDPDGNLLRVGSPL